MNKERDKFLTEAMGECYHERSCYGPCRFCGAHNFITNDFSSWEGFGKLLGFVEKQDYWFDLVETLEYKEGQLGFRLFVEQLDPDRFADFAYWYMKENIGRLSDD